MSENNAYQFEIKLPLFKGPFDLLLFFIERDELDIYDIPISKITNDFLEYIHQMEQMNIELASEFILVAATLMRIKAKMLLPRPEIDASGNEVDPREELVAHLLEYKKYKSVIGELSSMEETSLQKEKRGNILRELKHLSEVNNVEAELQDLDLFKLLKVFEKCIGRFEAEKNRPIHKVVQYPFTIEEKKEYILRKIDIIPNISFVDVLKDSQSKVEVIYSFLAILELLQLNKIMIFIGEGFNNFWIEKYVEGKIYVKNEWEETRSDHNAPDKE